VRVAVGSAASSARAELPVDIIKDNKTIGKDATEIRNPQPFSKKLEWLWLCFLQKRRLTTINARGTTKHPRIKEKPTIHLTDEGGREFPNNAPKRADPRMLVIAIATGEINAATTAV
jgi:hypothetical protein